jgi:hypothetical protein
VRERRVKESPSARTLSVLNAKERHKETSQRQRITEASEKRTKVPTALSLSSSLSLSLFLSLPLSLLGATGRNRIIQPRTARRRQRSWRPYAWRRTLTCNFAHCTNSVVGWP